MQEHIDNFIEALKPLILTIIGVSLGNLHNGLSILAVILASCYTARKWWLLEKNIKDNKNDN